MKYKEGIPFKVGDKVRIVKYGHWFLIHKSEQALYYEAGFTSKQIPDNIIKETENTYWVDMRPELVGQIGTIRTISITQGITSYSLNGIEDKVAWYNADQLEHVK